MLAIKEAAGHPEIHTTVCGNQYFHQMRFRYAGDFMPTHEHTYGHVTRVWQGSVKVYSARDGVIMMKAGDFLDVPAGVEHGMLALEDDTVMECTHILRRDDGTMVPFDYKLSMRDIRELTGAL